SEFIEKCIESWEKHLPDYEFVEWNEENFDINCNQFVKEAYEEKKWAFVSDYVRLWALYHYGGIYLDTDVEVLKGFDAFLGHDSFSGFEDD
ncbi:glycosyltransferase, partial [Brevibacillus sp. SIMBA_076]